MRERTKSEMRIYQDQNFEILLSITSWGEGTKEKTALEGLPSGGEHVACRTVLKAKVEEDFRFPKTLLIIHPPYRHRWFLFYTLAIKESNCSSMFLYQHLSDYFNNLKIN